jgi:hypothetical protein
VITEKLRRDAANCVTHHHACDCRELAVRELMEAVDWDLACKYMNQPIDSACNNCGDIELCAAFKKAKEVLG